MHPQLRRQNALDRSNAKFARDDALRRAENCARELRVTPLGDAQARARLHREALSALDAAVSHSDHRDGAGRPASPAPLIARALIPALDVLVAADHAHVPTRKVVAAARTVDAVIAQVPLADLLSTHVRHYLGTCARYSTLVELAPGREVPAERGAAS